MISGAKFLKKYDKVWIGIKLLSWLGKDQSNVGGNQIVKNTVMQIIQQQIYDCFNTNKKHWNFRIHICFGFEIIEP